MQFQKYLEHDNKPYYPTKASVDLWFRRINNRIFKQKLKPFRQVLIMRIPKIWGCVHYDEEIKPYVCDLHMNIKYPNTMHFVNVLAHEMVHKWQLEINLDTGNHNKHFFSWRQTFNDNGLSLSREM